LKKPHRHEVIPVEHDPNVPLSQKRALYTRLSDDDPESVSHAQQELAERQYAAAHHLTITRIYRDWRTGFDPNRLAFKQLIDDAHTGEHGGVIFYDHTRFHRGVSGAFPVVNLHRELPTYQFEAASGGTYDVEHVAIWAWQSGQEADNTRRRTMSQRRHRAANGELMAGNKPYWIERDPKTRRPVVVPERAAVIIEAIDRYANGVPMRQVAEWVDAHAPLAHGRASRWSGSRLRQAFRNPALAGHLPYARNLKRTERRNGEVFITGLDPNPNAIPFVVPPLIHASELERAECRSAGGCGMDAHVAADTLDELMRGNNARAAGRPSTLPHPLRRRVVCPCGWRMPYRPNVLRGGRQQDYGYLTCQRTRMRGQMVVNDYPPCAVGRARTSVLWPRVRELIIAAVRDPEMVIRQVEADILQAAASEARSQAEDDAVLETANTALSDLDAAEDRLYQRWDSKEITQGVYERQTARLAQERRLYEEAKRQVLDRRRILQTASIATMKLRQKLEKAAALPFEKLTMGEWTELLETLVADVVLDGQAVPHLRWHRE
ncbi:MAG TPA: recombinase family protein, partial [Chloroflexota bacterium]|nr:recombinase family protein [Chloroflexota bacterium]